MSATLLRTLTEKSTLKFGQHHDIPIWKMLERINTKKYLIWVYYNCSNISFNQSVLALLKLDGDRVIAKPGVDRDKYGKVLDKINAWLIGKHGVRHYGMKVKAKNITNAKINVNSRVSKAKLQSANHGR